MNKARLRTILLLIVCITLVAGCGKSVGNKTVQQAYYATIIRGYALVFVTSYATEDDKTTLKSVLNSLTWM